MDALRLRPTPASYQDLVLYRGLPLRLGDAMSCRCCSFLESTIKRKAPFSLLSLRSPRRQRRAGSHLLCFGFLQA
jgi:hypothetical protein